MSKREFLLLAYTLENPAEQYLGGWFLSEKMDGLRVFWDGGISRGVPIKEVPYANTEKDDIKIEPNYNATGLWSRNAKAVQAPEWFLDLLPKFPLDGELWSGHQKWERTSSIVRRLKPDEKDWESITYYVFDSPSLMDVFSNGVIDTIHYRKEFNKETLSWITDRCRGREIAGSKYQEFEFVYSWLKSQGIENKHLKILDQIRLPHARTEYEAIINQKMEEVSAWHGEGLMVRRDQSYWRPERSHNLMKIKKWYDAEATVKGYVFGRKTSKGSKLLGLMGTMIVDWDGKVFEVSGFDWLERELFFPSGASAKSLGNALAGKLAPVEIINPKFPIGSVITFRYRDLTAAGIPKNANYYRKPTT